jgi:GAF domain-containing protein
MNRLSNKEAISRLKVLLQNEGIGAAISFLNGLTKYRFTALHYFSGETLRNVHFYDRDHPTFAVAPPDIAVADCYCAFIRSSGRAFGTPDALHDKRLRDHPKRRDLRSYCGAPLMGFNGPAFGAICHFDNMPVEITLDDVHLLERVGRLLGESSPWQLPSEALMERAAASAYFRPRSSGQQYLMC